MDGQHIGPWRQVRMKTCLYNNGNAVQGSASLSSVSLLVEELGGGVENAPRCDADHGVEITIMLLHLGQVGVDELDAGDGALYQQLLQ